jgi:hypothetical protein
VILDLDATLVTAHSDKEQAAGTYKHGFGFRPLLCYEATSEEALAGILRPGNAGANTACDHVELLELALAQLPLEAVGPGLLIRADSGGATHAFLDHLVSLGLRFSVGFDLTEPVREAVLALPEKAWRPALSQAGEPRDGAAVAELSLDPRVGRPARARSAAASGRIRAPNSPSPTTTATASRSSSPSSKAARSSGSSSCTASTPSSRTGSAAAKTPVCATSPSAASKRTLPGSSSPSARSTYSPGRSASCSPPSSLAASRSGSATGSSRSPVG